MSTRASAITLAIVTGLRMSARTKSTPSSGTIGATTSTPMTESTEGSSRSRSASIPPSGRATPVTSTTRCTGDYFLLRRWTRVFLQQLAVLLLRHALAALLDDGTHGYLSASVGPECWGHPAPEAYRPAHPTGCAATSPATRPRRALGGGAVDQARLDEGVAQVIVDGLLGDPERAPDANRGQFVRCARTGRRSSSRRASRRRPRRQ